MSNITKYILVLITALAISVFHHSFSFAETYNTYPYGYTDTQIDTNQKISKIFNNLETTGNAFNSGGSNAVTGVLLDTGCRDAIDYIMKTNLFHDIKEDITLPKIENSIYRKYLSGRLDGFGQNSINQLCAAVKGDDIQSIDINSLLNKGLHNDILRDVITYSKDYVGDKGIPFLQNLEIEMGSSQRSLVGSITSIQPLWQDKSDTHHVFTQLSWHKAPDTTNEQGVKDRYDTYNAGMAYRFLTNDKKYLYGANLFFDYAPLKDHTRMSLGIDARTSQLAISLNRYMPLSNWKSNSTYNEERATAGWDA